MATLALHNLSGQHLRIVTINENRFTTMLDDSGALLPAANWTGLIPEMIGWIANQSGFTYTLTSPSGNGSSCTPADGSGTQLEYSRQYNCGQDDVTQLGVADVYAGAFYVTESRLEAGAMSTLHCYCGRDSRQGRGRDWSAGLRGW